MKVSIIIPTYNGKKYLKTCFDSIYCSSFDNFEIILVDDGSNDGTVQFVKENYPKIKIATLKTNQGFCKAVNTGIKIAQGKFIALLNNDTKVDPSWLSEMYDIAEKDKRIGMVAPKVLLFYEKNLIDSAGLYQNEKGNVFQRGFKEKDIGQYDKIEEADGACAGAVLINRKMLEQIGLFPEEFFMFCDDVDLSLRAKRCGWKIIYTPSAIVYHVHSATSVKIPSFKAYYLERNEYAYRFRNLDGWLFLHFIFRDAKDTFFNFFRFLASDTEKFMPFIKARFFILLHFPSLIAQRKKIHNLCPKS